MNRMFTSVASWLSSLMGRPLAFVLAVLFMVMWGATGPIFHWSDTWQLVANTATNVITFLMVFLIQNSQNRDGAAIQAKLDELLRSSSSAREQFIGIEHFTDTQLDELRTRLEHESGCRSGGKEPAAESVERLLDRYQGETESD